MFCPMIGETLNPILYMHRENNLDGQKQDTISGVTYLLTVMVRRYLVERST